MTLESPSSEPGNSPTRAAADGDGRCRVLVEDVRPEVEQGRYPAKRVAGDTVTVEADVFADGHDALRVLLLHRTAGEEEWSETEMRPLGNDRWRASFGVEDRARYQYTVRGWVDGFKTWRRDLQKRADSDQDVATELRVGAELLERAAGRAEAEVTADARKLRRAAGRLREAASGGEVRGSHQALELALDEELARLADRYPDDRFAVRYRRVLEVLVERPRARFSSWYEMFPRSAASESGRHGTLADVEARLPYVERLGFDVLYLPPVHPIGRTNRKGPNNAPRAGPDDPGSPWAIGASEGGHRSIHPELGTLADFRSLVDAAGDRGIEVAMDLAFQCSPDHPYVDEHPEWFRRLPDGTVRHAENPPKKYEDIVPFDFESDSWEELWRELLDVVLFWAEQGVRIFRVDNPHTKPFPFWEWLISRVRSEHPDVLFLSEAFTRPKVMYRLAKLGFTQSYTYFAWRNTASGLRDYLTELTATETSEYFRPNLWPNTPDILTEELQTGGRPAFRIRLILAATLGASYGIYGPPFELAVSEPREPESEEYLDSEKYEIRHWDLEGPDTLADLIARVNEIRRENPALHRNRTLRFHGVEDEAILAYSKGTPDGENVVLVVVNTDPHHGHAGWTSLDLEALGLAPDASFQVHDLLTGARYVWSGARNYVELEPEETPAHVFRIESGGRDETDYEYFI